MSITAALLTLFHICARPLILVFSNPLSTHSSSLSEVVALAREVLGGNGVVADFHVAKQFCDMEAIYTYEVNPRATGQADAFVQQLLLPAQYNPHQAIVLHRHGRSDCDPQQEQNPTLNAKAVTFGAWFRVWRSQTAVFAAAVLLLCCCLCCCCVVCRAPTRSMCWWQAVARPASLPSRHPPRQHRSALRTYRPEQNCLAIMIDLSLQLLWCVSAAVAADA